MPSFWCQESTRSGFNRSYQFALIILLHGFATFAAAELPDPKNVFPAPAPKAELAGHVGKVKNRINGKYLPSFWPSLDGSYPTDPQESNRLVKLVNTVKDGNLTNELSIGSRGEVRYWDDRILMLTFYKTENTQEQRTDNFGKVVLVNVPSSKPLPDAEQKRYRDEFNEQANQVLNFRSLEQFDTYDRQAVFFGILKNRQPIEDEAEEELIRGKMYLLMTGEPVKEFAVDSVGQIFFKQSSIQVRWYSPGRATSEYAPALPMGAQLELSARLRRHARYLLQPLPAQGALTFDQFRGPSVRDNVNTRRPPESYKPGIAGPEFATRLVGFDSILEFVRAADADLAKRIEQELAVTKVSLIEVDSLSFGASSMTADLIHNYGNHNIRIANRRFEQLDQNRTDKRNQSYAFLYALLQGLRPLSDLDRSHKAHLLSLKLYQLEKNKGVDKVTAEDVQPLLQEFYMSNKTQLMLAMVEHFKDISVQEKAWLEASNASDSQVSKDFDAIVGLIKQRASRAVAEDLSAILNRPLEYSMARTEDDLAAFRLEVWDMLNKIRPRVDQSFYNQKLRALQIAVERIVSGEITAEDIQKIRARR